MDVDDGPIIILQDITAAIKCEIKENLPTEHPQTEIEEKIICAGSAEQSVEIKEENVELMNENIIMNSSATDDESMAVEALRQLGNSTMFNQSVQTRIKTTTPHDLPLLSCLTCDLQFRTTADLHNHSAICKHSQLKCQICNETFERKTDLNNHLVCHAVDRPHSCRMCGTLFINKKDLIQHMLTHSNVSILNQCQVCGLSFSRPCSLTNHMKIHSYQPGRAFINTVTRFEADNPHLSTLLNKPSADVVVSDMTLAEESKPLPSISNIGNLNSWNLGYETPSTIDDFGADINVDVAQEMIISTVDNILAYDPIKIEVDKLSHVEETVEKIQSQKGKSDAIKKQHECLYCHKRFTREKALLSHMKIHTGDNFHQCEVCDECFSDEFSLVKHVANCVGRTSEEKNSQPVEQQADKIRRDFSTVLKLKSIKHACTECEKMFSTKQKLYRHMWIHRKKTYSCEMCSQCFEKQEELDNHRLNTHQGNSAYFCRECGKNFSSRQGLWEHARIHGPVPSLYECEECFKQFSSRQGYLIHKRTHSNERPYGCRFCWKAFRDGGTLRKHERIHTGERPHVCPLCTKAFNQKVVLREHVRWLHSANRQPDADGFISCLICEQKISDKDELCAHIVKHSDQMATLAKNASKRNIVSKNQAVVPRSKGKKARKVVNKCLNQKTNVIALVNANLDTEIVSNTCSEETVPNSSTNTDGEMLSFIEDYVSDDDDAFACEICGKKFNNRTDSSEHVKMHI